MEFRLAMKEDLPKLKTMYRKLIKNMYENQINIMWDDIYPYEFFKDDIINKRLYILNDNKKIVAAFALCDLNPGEKSMRWKQFDGKALYLNRLGVNVNYLRRGMGSLMVKKAKEISKNMWADYLRVFVVDVNKPALELYIKNGFKKVEGIYHEVIDDKRTVHAYGYEIKL